MGTHICRVEDIAVGPQRNSAREHLVAGGATLAGVAELVGAAVSGTSGYSNAVIIADTKNFYKKVK